MTDFQKDFTAAIDCLLFNAPKNMHLKIDIRIGFNDQPILSLCERNSFWTNAINSKRLLYGDTVHDRMETKLRDVASTLDKKEINGFLIKFDKIQCEYRIVHKTFLDKQLDDAAKEVARCEAAFKKSQDDLASVKKHVAEWS
jgi:hypothetical protein